VSINFQCFGVKGLRSIALCYIMDTNATNSTTIPAKYNCVLCEYITNNKFDYRKHIMTGKHKKAANATKKLPKDTIHAGQNLQYDKWFECKQCGKKYNHLSSVSRHKKTCKMSQDKNDESLNASLQKDISFQKEIIINLMRDNKKLNEQIELYKEENDKINKIKHLLNI